MFYCHFGQTEKTRKDHYYFWQPPDASSVSLHVTCNISLFITNNTLSFLFLLLLLLIILIILITIKNKQKFRRSTKMYLQQLTTPSSTTSLPGQHTNNNINIYRFFFALFFASLCLSLGVDNFHHTSVFLSIASMRAR